MTARALLGHTVLIRTQCIINKCIFRLDASILWPAMPRKKRRELRTPVAWI